MRQASRVAENTTTKAVFILYPQSSGCGIFLSVFRGEDMADKREKTISYRRAIWAQGGYGLTLEKCIKDAHAKLKSLNERTISHGGQLTRSAKQRNSSGGGVYLHLTVETPGEATSIIPHFGPTAPDVNLKIQKAPSNAEYLDADAFVLFTTITFACARQAFAMAQ